MSAERNRMIAFVRDVAKSSRKPIAVFLGAGASKPFGYPITRELMFKIFRHLRNQGGSHSQGRSQRVGSAGRLADFLRQLLPGERVSTERVPMVTGVLSLLDHSIATGQVLLPGTSIDETREARQSLERELIRSIPDDEWFNKDEEDDFDTYCDWLSSLYRARPKSRLGLITSNYDMLSDLAACYVSKVRGKPGDWRYADVARKIDFGFRWNHPYKDMAFPRPTRPRFSLYKLHGSTNWLRCPLCENLYINPDGPISLLAGASFHWLGNTCDCSETKLEAQIVSPSFIRAMRDPNLIAIWKNALDLLREAQHWVIIGYGFPDEDVAIRALFTRALGSRPKPPRVSVIQHDTNALKNYESFFAQERFQYYTGGLQLLIECQRRPRAS